MQVDVTSLDNSISMVKNWNDSTQNEGRYICVSNVHMCMETFDNKDFKLVVNNADLVIPDGKPLFWAQKLLGQKNAQQVRGTDIMLRLCEYAEKHRVSIGFYGGTTELLYKLKNTLVNKFPNIDIACQIAPPFRPLTEEEDKSFTQQINESKVRILFVGIGCPKQERWMAEHRSQLSCTMLGVGAAFDFITGRKKEAPRWMQNLGLEWLFRLLCEPKRLWKRYIILNPRFIWHFSKQWIQHKRSNISM